MTSPVKPWERAKGQTSATLSSLRNANTTDSTTRTPLSSSMPSPPLPSREDNSFRSDMGGYSSGAYGNSLGYSSYGGGYGGNYGGYGGGYGGYGGYGNYSSRYGGLTSRYGSLGSYGGYGGYGGYGAQGGYGGYGGYGSRYGGDMIGPTDEWGHPPQDEFSSALDRGHKWMMDLQWLVEGFGRFTRLLDYNFDAMYGSFTNIVRVVDSFGLLRSEITNGLKALAIFGMLKLYSRRIVEVFRRMLGLQTSPAISSGEPQEWENQFQSSMNPAQAGPFPHQPTAPGIPRVVIFFFAVMLGGPLLFTALLKILKALFTKNSVSINQETAQPLALARALYAFPGQRPEDLSFQAGDLLEVIGRHNENWLKARIKGTSRVGLIPKTYVKRVANEEEAVPLPSQDERNIPEQRSFGGGYDADRFGNRMSNEYGRTPYSAGYGGGYGNSYMGSYGGGYGGYRDWDAPYSGAGPFR